MMNSNQYQHDTTGRLSVEDAMMLDSPHSSPTTRKITTPESNESVDHRPRAGSMQERTPDDERLKPIGMPKKIAF